MTQLGALLDTTDQHAILRSYIHRFTGEHTPSWVRGVYARYPHFANDRDWLRGTTFHVRLDGRLDKRYTNCHSTPTWPHGKHGG